MKNSNSIKCDIWNIPKGKVPEDAKAFVYRILFDDGYFYIGYKLMENRRNGEKLPWEKYRTSSKITKRKIKEGHGFEAKIVIFFSEPENAPLFETKYLLKVDALNNDRCLNKAIYKDGLMRAKETYTEESSKNISESLKLWFQQEDSVHPLAGKVHPNRGKKLPQTAPKNHVSKNNIQITDGIINKWWPKNDPIPEGFRRGLVTVRGELTEKELAAKRQVAKDNHKRAKRKYEQNAKSCIICDKVLSYEDRHRKTCGKSCYSKFRSNVSKRNKISERSRKEGALKRQNALAVSKGFEDYEDMANKVVDFYRTHTIKEVVEMSGLSPTGINGCCKYVGFKKRGERNK